MMEKSELIAVIEAVIEKAKADGCIGCKHIDKDDWEMPCAKCKRCVRDYWERKEYEA